MKEIVEKIKQEIEYEIKYLRDINLTGMPNDYVVKITAKKEAFRICLDIVNRATTTQQ